MKYVPVGIVIDADGQLARPVNMVDIGDPTFRSELEKWAATGVRPGSWDGTESAPAEQSTPEEQQSDACLQQAVCC